MRGCQVCPAPPGRAAVGRSVRNGEEFVECYLDCSNGISGDMTLAALAHLGVDFSPLTALLERAGVNCRLDVLPETRAAGPGFRATVSWNAAEQPLRHPADMEAIFRAADVRPSVRRRALKVLDALTRAEAHAHAIPPENVHFHEVGAVDTLVDILGVCYGLEQLGVERVTASPLPWFSGSVDCAHGRIPLPAPATAWLLRGKPFFPTDAREELITPTGAALLHALADSFVPGPQGVVAALGTGYGSRPAPAGLRIWLLDPAAPRADHCRGGQENVLQLESHVDHLNGEDLGAALGELAAMPEVLDVLWLPGVGKKNRPSGLLRVLCLPEFRDVAVAAVLRHTHTLGLRVQTLGRIVVGRQAARMRLAGEDLEAKAYVLEGRRCLRPEADALRRAAQKLGVGIPALRYARRPLRRPRSGGA